MTALTDQQVILLWGRRELARLGYKLTPGQQAQVAVAVTDSFGQAALEVSWPETEQAGEGDIERTEVVPTRTAEELALVISGITRVANEFRASDDLPPLAARE